GCSMAARGARAGAGSAATGSDAPDPTRTLRPCFLDQQSVACGGRDLRRRVSEGFFPNAARESAADPPGSREPKRSAACVTFAESTLDASRAFLVSFRRNACK